MVTVESVFGVDSVGYSRVVFNDGITFEEFMRTDINHSFYAIREMQKDLVYNTESVYRIFLYRTMDDAMYEFYGRKELIKNKEVHEEFQFEHYLDGPNKIWFSNGGYIYESI